MVVTVNSSPNHLNYPRLDALRKFYRYEIDVNSAPHTFCNAMVVHSGRNGTVVARGSDLPEALELVSKASSARHALYLDFEAEGADLVMRVRITTIDPDLPIVYARSLSANSGTRR